MGLPIRKLRPSLPGHSDPCGRPASNHLYQVAFAWPQPKAPGRDPRASGQDGHPGPPGGGRWAGERTLTEPCVARIRACVLDSQISHLCSEPELLHGDLMAGRGSCHRTLTGDVGTIPQVAVKGSDKPVGSSKVGPSPGVVTAVCPQV